MTVCHFERESENFRVTMLQDVQHEPLIVLILWHVCSSASLQFARARLGPPLSTLRLKLLNTLRTVYLAFLYEFWRQSILGDWNERDTRSIAFEPRISENSKKNWAVRVSMAAWPRLVRLSVLQGLGTVQQTAVRRHPAAATCEGSLVETWPQTVG